MHILLIEDEDRITDFVMSGFRAAGLEAEACAEGTLGLRRALDGHHDAIVLDLMLPGLDGLAILQALREAGRKTPVILLTAKTELEHRLAGFDAGADDYLPKPFFIEELIVRLRTLVERNAGKAETVLRHSGMELDRISRQASWGGNQAVLSQREFTLIEYLMRSPGHIFSRSQILQHVWGLDFDPQTNVVDVCILRARRKLTPPRDGQAQAFPVEAIRGIGYCFREQ
ncbi:MAG: hypothetical protein RL404_2685 [Pseudomonadota bacterium]|jgi:DNA-binding response OmpR family regulator